MERNVRSIWEDDQPVVVATEQVISHDDEHIIHVDHDEFEEIVESDNVDDREEVRLDDVMYITGQEIAMIEQQAQNHYGYQFLEVSSEEVITDQWPENCSEVVVGPGISDPNADDFEIPLPTDQDEYTAARPYPCDFCSRRFRKKANLMNHMVAHQTDRPHSCNLCGVRYIRRCDLINHLKIHAYVPDTGILEEEEMQMMDDSDNEKTYKRSKSYGRKRKKYKDEIVYDDQAPMSSRQYNYFENNMRLLESGNNSAYSMEGNRSIQEPRFPVTDPRKPFVCQHCGVGFTREKALASHARVHGGDSPFECETCEEVFWDIELLQDHVRVKHGGIDQSFDDDDDYDDEDYSGNEDDIKYGQFYCPTCGMSFHRQDNMRRHQRIHIKEELAKDDYGHTCNVCGDSFPEALDLLAHAEVHTRSWEHRCMICGELCVDEQAVAAHVQSKHGNNLPPNTCVQCGRTCKDRRTLIKHSFEHSREKSFSCSKCDKNFHNKARLKRHMMSHRNKVVSCEECGEDFPDGRSLMNHRHSHSSVSGRHFPCRECGKTFGSRSSQQIHIRIHTGERPYGCRFCWKAFADGGTLRKHERIHTGEKPYACAVCPRAFNQRVVLREHIRSHHSGPDPNYSHSMTPFSCLVCSDLFATSQDLITHLIHHCDLNTAMKRQPQVGPRKYKRRRKLKPHELEIMCNRPNYEEEEPPYSNFDDEDEYDYKRKITKKPKKTPPKSDIEESYTDVYNSFSSAIENINNIVNSKSNKLKRKIKTEVQQPAPPPMVPSRPKMIHTQKTRVPVESVDGGKVRHRTKTLVTHTQPAELKSATGERIRPRTKNVSYHILQTEKLPVATFPDDTEQAVNNLIASDSASHYNNEHHNHSLSNGIAVNSEVTIEQTIDSDLPLPTNIIKLNSSSDKKRTYSLRPGRTIIGPSDKIVRFLKDGVDMVVSKAKWVKEEAAQPPEPIPAPEPAPDPLPQQPTILPEAMPTDYPLDEKPNIIVPTVQSFTPLEEVEQVQVKTEIIYEPTPLQELAEVSVRQAEKMLTCDMCNKLCTDRDQLLEHIRIHICI